MMSNNLSMSIEGGSTKYGLSDDLRHKIRMRMDKMPEHKNSTGCWLPLVVGANFKFSPGTREVLRRDFKNFHEYVVNQLEECVGWELINIRATLSGLSKAQVNKIFKDLGEATEELLYELRNLDSSVRKEIDLFFGNIEDGARGSTRRRIFTNEIEALSQTLKKRTDSVGRKKGQWTFLICCIAETLHIYGMRTGKELLGEILSLVFAEIGWPKEDATRDAINKAWPYVKESITRIESGEDGCPID